MQQQDACVILSVRRKTADPVLKISGLECDFVDGTEITFLDSWYETVQISIGGKCNL